MKEDKSKKFSFHESKWFLCSEQKKDSEKRNIGNVVVFTKKENLKSKRNQELLSRLGRACIIVEVEYGGEIKRANQASYEVDGSEEGYRYILKEIGIQHISQIILNYAEEDADAQTGHVYINTTLKSTFYIIKELANIRECNELKLILLCVERTYTNSSEIKLNAYWNMLRGLGRSLGNECENILVRTVEADKLTPIDTVVNEMFSEFNYFSVALLKKERYTEQVKQLFYSQQFFNNLISLIDKKMYVVTGGLGAMGLAFTEYLLSLNANIGIVLVDSSCSEEKFFQRDSDTARTYKKWRQDGVDVHIVQADIMDHECIGGVFQRIRDEYGEIHGVINAASVSNEGLLKDKNWGEFWDVIKPKLKGTIMLDYVTKEDPIDLFIMCSSDAVWNSKVGQVANGAANAFIDSFAIGRQHVGKQAIVVDMLR